MYNILVVTGAGGGAGRSHGAFVSGGVGNVTLPVDCAVYQ